VFFLNSVTSNAHYYGGLDKSGFEHWAAEISPLERSELTPQMRATFERVLQYCACAKLGRRRNAVVAYWNDPRFGPSSIELS
jgi:hypothetical protein